MMPVAAANATPAATAMSAMPAVTIAMIVSELLAGFLGGLAAILRTGFQLLEIGKHA